MKKPSATKDITKRAGNILSYVKHLCSDPIKSSTEASDRKKEILQALYVCLAILGAPFLVSIILIILPIPMPGIISNIITSIQMPIVAIGFVGTVFCLIIFANINKAITKFENIECSNCKKRFVYSDAIKYEIIREWEKSSKSYNSNTQHVRVEQLFYAEVGVTVKCPDCGTVDKFITTFNTEKWVDGSCRSSYGIPELLESYFEDVKPISIWIIKRKKK